VPLFFFFSSVANTARIIRDYIAHDTAIDAISDAACSYFRCLPTTYRHLPLVSCHEVTVDMLFILLDSAAGAPDSVHYVASTARDARVLLLLRAREALLARCARMRDYGLR